MTLEESQEQLKISVDAACAEMDRLRAINRELLEALELTEQSLSGVPLTQIDVIVLMNSVRAAIRKATGGQSCQPLETN